MSELIPHKGWYSRGYLPHCDEAGRLQSITFRLCDSLPSQLVQLWSQAPQLLPDAARARYQRALDEGHGACLLGQPAVATLVQDTLLHYDGEHYRLIAWVIMPNHVHVVVEMGERYPLPKMVRVWKTFSAHAVNGLVGREGPLWYRDYYDRLIRNDEHLLQCVRYVDNNPVKAGLVASPDEWLFGSARLRAAEGWR